MVRDGFWFYVSCGLLIGVVVVAGILWPKPTIPTVKFTPPLASDVCRGYLLKNEWDKKSLPYWMALDACQYGVEVARREGR